jgi:hypothetical protein
MLTAFMMAPRSQVDEHRARLHSLDGFRGDEQRRPPARHLGGGNDHVEAADLRGELGLLGGLLVGSQRPGVPALARRRRDRVELEEPGTDGFDLIPRLGPDVVSGHHGSEPASGAHGLQAGHPRAEHEDAGGPARPGRGDQHGEESPEVIGGDQHRLVAGHVRLRGERVHVLGPAQRARQPVQADRGHPGLGQLTRQVRLDQWPQHTDDRLAGAQSADQVRRGRADADEDVGPVDGLVPADDFRADSFVGAVGEARRGTRAGLHQDMHAGAGEHRNRLGHQRDTLLSRHRLPDGTDGDSRLCYGIAHDDRSPFRFLPMPLPPEARK